MALPLAAPEGRARTAARAAFLASGINLAAGVVMLFVLRSGLPAAGSTLDERMTHIAAHPAGWRYGWLLWNAAGISLLAFFVALALRWRRRAPVRCGLALVLAAAGLSADLVAEAMLMGVLTQLARAEFAVVEATAIMLTGYLGNGLYTVAGILLTSAGFHEMPRSLTAIAATVWGAGLWLSAATLAHSSTGQLWSTAILMPLFVLWTALVGRWLLARAS